MEGDMLLDVQPDRTGPKNLAVLLFFGSLLVLWMGYADLQAHRYGLSEGQVETLLATPNAQGGEPTTVEDFRTFEEEARSENAFLLRAVSLLTSGGLLLVGALLLFRLQRQGSDGQTKSHHGAADVHPSLVSGQQRFFQVDSCRTPNHQACTNTSKQSDDCSCTAQIGAKPLLNLRARLALLPVKLVIDDESE